MLISIGGVIVAPALRTVVDSLSTGQGGVATLQLGGRDRSPATDPVTTTAPATVTTTPTAPPLTPAPVTAPASPAPAPPPAPVVEPAPPAVPVQPITIKGGRGRTQAGKASWYEIDNGTCAHVRLPKGTIVRVVNVANGKEALCRVADRGPFLQGRVIDLDLQTFQQIASPSEGVVDVRISW